MNLKHSANVYVSGMVNRAITQLGVELLLFMCSENKTLCCAVQTEFKWTLMLLLPSIVLDSGLFQWTER